MSTRPITDLSLWRSASRAPKKSIASAQLSEPARRTPASATSRGVEIDCDHELAVLPPPVGTVSEELDALAALEERARARVRSSHGPTVWVEASDPRSGRARPRPPRGCGPGKSSPAIPRVAAGLRSRVPAQRSACHQRSPSSPSARARAPWSRIFARSAECGQQGRVEADDGVALDLGGRSRRRPRQLPC